MAGHRTTTTGSPRPKKSTSRAQRLLGQLSAEIATTQTAAHRARVTVDSICAAAARGLTPEQERWLDDWSTQGREFFKTVLARQGHTQGTSAPTPPRSTHDQHCYPRTG